jgi:hypothetical protein
MKTQIAITGHSFVSGDKLPPEMRDQAEQVLQTLQGTTFNDGQTPATICGQPAVAAVTQQFIVNGHRYASLDEIPENERKLFEQVSNALLAQALGGAKSCSPAGAVDEPQHAAGFVPPTSPTFLNPGKEESDLGWLVQFFVLILGVIIGLAIAGAVWFAIK